jgi:hypothetical protein
MTLTLIEMTKSTLPGVTKTTSLYAYRYGGYYDLGWRSADDPGWTGQGSEAATPHVGDNSLHGGGTELDSAEIGANTGNLAVTALSMTAVPGLVVTVPTLLRPVHLMGHLHLRSSTASTTVAATFAPVGSSSLVAGRGIAYGATRATADPVTVRPFHVVPAGSAAADWQAFVTATASVNIIAVSVDPQGKSSVRAVTA